MSEYTFVVTQYSQDRPWVIEHTEERTVDLPDGADFHTWAGAEYPAPRYAVQELRDEPRWAPLIRPLE